ncbi:MAG: NUDIX domain-containing protein [Spirochaetaceae bacterium]|jgi:ADP-ribose pyrophosphatase YjhB (NUDIX family)|nr:NUDIX domain-containing protein [Spirochaetaceae bacterium]
MTGDNQNFLYCPECGQKNTVTYVNRRHWVCSSCGFNLYNNVAAAVGVIIPDEAGRALFIRRAKEPRAGFLALPGGFIDPGERAEEAALRECAEETALALTDLRYLASFPNIYVYKTVTYSTCDIFFTARAEDFSPRAADGEAAGFALESVRTREDIAALPLAFPSAARALEAWLASLSK